MSKYSKTSLLRVPNNIKSVAKAYLENQEEYVRTFTVRINGKKRQIITYAADEKGTALKHVHTYIATLIPLCYKSMPNSYAYKKGSSILQCVEKHLESDTFLKTDIHEFFESIQYEILLDVLFEDKTCAKNKSKLKLLLNSCFYEGHMPIGFITSPVLSDLYLHKVDEQFMGREGIIYTRYADDFIISGKDNIDDLETIKSELTETLDSNGLSLNSKKTYFRTLKQPGDAIHVLGVNIVNDSPRINRITVSDRYIRDTSKDICNFLDERDNMTLEETCKELMSLVGRIEFIRYVSPSSYRKLEKMVSIKHGSSVQLQDMNIYLSETTQAISQFGCIYEMSNLI